MADRYWVGGAGNWTTTNTANWSASSGGAGGASVPTSVDNAFFDANSGTGNVSIASSTVSCANLTFTGFAGTLLGSSGFTIAVFGNFTAGSAMTWAATSAVAMSATSGSYTIDCAGKTLTSTIAVGPSGTSSTATWTLASALLLSGSSGILLPRSGTFTSAGYNITVNNFAISTSLTKTVNLGASLVTLNGAAGFNTTAGSGLTLNAGTSTLAAGTTTTVFNAPGFTLNNISFPGASTPGALIFSSCNDFSIAVSGGNTKLINLQNDLVINGVFSTSGTAGNARVVMVSSASGTARTLTINGSTSLSDIDFRDITVTGPAAPISGTRIGNLKGDAGTSGITFSTPKTVYWNSSNTIWTNNGWAATSGGTPSTDNFPLPQDTAIFDNAGTVGTSGTLTIPNAYPYLPTVDMSARTTAMSLSFSGVSIAWIYGNWINNSSFGFTAISSTTFYFVGRNTQSITSAGVTMPNMIISSIGGTVNLNDAFTTSGTSTGVLVFAGTFNTNNYNITTGYFQSNNSAFDRTTNLGSSTLTLSGFSPISLNSSGGGVLTFNAGTSTINCTGSSPTFNVSGSQQTFNNVSFTSTSASTLTVTGNMVFNNLTFTSSATNPSVVQVNCTGPWVVNGTFTANGTSVKQRIWFIPNNMPTAMSISAATTSISDSDYQRITASGTGSWSGTRLGDRGGNSGITFPAAKTVYWNLAGAQLWTANGWAATSGGAPADNNFPLPQDTAVFDNTGSVTGTISISSAVVGLPTIDMSARTSAMTLSVTVYVAPLYGSLIAGSGLTFTASSGGGFDVAGSGTQTFTSAGKSMPYALLIRRTGGSMVLSDNLDISGSTQTTNIDLWYGTLDLNGKTLTSKNFVWSNIAAGTLAFGAGVMNLTNNSQTVWNVASLNNLTITGTPTVNLTYSGATGTRTVSHGSSNGGSEAKAVDFNVTAGTDTITLTANGHLGSLNFTGFAGTLNNNAISVYGNVTISTGMTVNNSSAAWTFRSTSGTKTIRTNGKTLFPLTFDGVGGAWQLQDALTVATVNGINLTNGTLDLAGYTATTGFININAGTKAITFNGGTLACAAGSTLAFNNANPTGLTLTNGSSTGTISMTSASAKTFVGGGFTYPCNVNQGGAGTLTVTGNNTFANFTDSVPTANTISFTGGSVNNFTAFSVSGTAGNLITLNSTNTTRATLSKATRWYMGANSVNSGNNRNLTFSAGDGIDYLNVSYIEGLPVVPGGGKFIMFF